MQIFSFPIIVATIGNFSVANKLGQGGFGPVYKGVLPDGQEIAIKILSSRSGQGLVEFKNEAQLVAKLQHTNFVKLLGLCIQNEENILIYEYLPNKILDFHLFGSEFSEENFIAKVKMEIVVRKDQCMRIDGANPAELSAMGREIYDIQGWGEYERRVSYTFGADRVVEDGYEFFVNMQLVHIFSVPKYCGEFDNVGAVMIVDETLVCFFQILKPV
ncbi:hypothetical protein JHK87_048003 [Glycine soja]|nr:hypothetical protein JHK87_048003 [Glycine soja]